METTTFPPMNPEWKAKWLDALRSGKYTQGPEQLRNPDGTYCCLGVLADIAGVTWHKHETPHLKSEYWIAEYAGHQNGIDLPKALCETVQLDWLAQVFLMIRNDDAGWTFAQISDWIEEHL